MKFNFQDIIAIAISAGGYFCAAIPLAVYAGGELSAGGAFPNDYSASSGATSVSTCTSQFLKLAR